MINNVKNHVLKIFFLAVITAFLFSVASLVIHAGGKIDTGSVAGLKITILYDNYVFTEGQKRTGVLPALWKDRKKRYCSIPACNLQSFGKT